MENRGFYTTKKIDELSEIEALVLVNRWAKSNYFYHEDRDSLYQIKEHKILDWLNSGELKLQAIVKRESEFFQNVKEELKSEGENLGWLNFGDYNSYLTKEEERNLQVLYDLTTHEDYQVKYPEEIYQNWIDKLKPEIEAYKIAKQEYDLEAQRRQPILQKYSEDLSAFKQRKEQAAKEWAKENQVKIARSNSGKSLKKDWLKRLEKQGFTYLEPVPQQPFAKKLVPPKPVQYPDRTYPVSFETYVPGSISEIDAVLDWARSIIELPPVWEIDEDFVCTEFEQSLSNLVLKRLVTEDILPIFQQIVDRKLLDPKEIYSRLTQYDIDYEFIGLESYYHFRYQRSTHRYYSKWHEINLSPTGLWLVEFQSTQDATITFHSPYNDFCLTYDKQELDKLPGIDSSNEKFGRAIDSKEKSLYPIEKLVEILGYSADDFPFGLEEFVPVTRGNWRNFEYEDEDWYDEEGGFSD